jgi:hypothetical protein
MQLFHPNSGESRFLKIRRTSIMPRITNMPSPLGTNRERLYIFRSRQPLALGALDAALNRHGDEDAPDLAALHVELSEVLAEVLSGEELDRAMARLDECLGGAARQYDDGHDEEEDDLPRNRVSEYDREARDRKRMARDRRRQMASDAADERAESFDLMFPDAARIRIGGF